MVLAAIGIAPNTEDLKLENTGIKLKKSGHIIVNDY